MNTFALILSDSFRTQQFDNVVQFIGSDGSGAFGVKARHRKMVAVLRYGLARFLNDDGKWYYLALPSGVLRFSDNALTLATTRYFLGEERSSIVNQLSSEMAREDSDVHTARATLAQIEKELVRRLNALNI